jgi:type I restriction enzyme R subunit
MNEADSCGTYVVPKPSWAGWDADPHSFTEQKTFTDGAIVVIGTKVQRREQKRADSLLRTLAGGTIAWTKVIPCTVDR